MKKFTLIFSLLLTISFSSCVLDGPEGPAGRDGNANILSINYLVLESDWVEVGKAGDEGFYMALDLNVPEISQDILDNGLVLAYYRANDSDPWTALPFTRISHNPEFIEKLDLIYDLGFVGLQSMASDRGATPYVGTVRIIVASAIPTGKTSLDTENYEEVADYFDIETTRQYYRTAN